MERHHPYHLAHFPQWMATGLSPLYLNATLRSMAISMTGIFIPLYILKTTQNLAFVFGYYLLWRLVHLGFLFPLVSLVRKIGFRWSILLSTLFWINKTASLILAAQNPWFFAASAVFGGLLVPLYWLPRHLIVVADGSQPGFADEVSNFGILSRVARAVGPFIGGTLVTFFGFNHLYLTVMLIMVLSSFPLFFMHHHRKEKMPKAGKVIRGLFDKRFLLNFLAFKGAGMEGTLYGIVWPIFIFLAIESYEVLGIIKSAVLLISVGTFFWLGKYFKKIGKKFFRWGILGNGMILTVFGFLSYAWQIFFFDALYQIGAIFIWVPFNTAMYGQAVQDHPLEFFLRREIGLDLGRILGLLIFGGLLVAGVPWWLVFCLGIPGLVLTMVMVR